jgi:hypothetical protein
MTKALSLYLSMLSGFRAMSIRARYTCREVARTLTSSTGRCRTAGDQRNEGVPEMRVSWHCAAALTLLAYRGAGCRCSPG